MLDQHPIVYVVDDDLAVRESLSEWICSAGWRPLVFASAEEFVSQPCWACPSCLILEPMLPGVDGFQLQRQLANERMDMPIIFITLRSDVAMTVRAMKAGATEFLTKPLRVAAVLEAVSAALERSRWMQGAALEIRTLQDRYQRLSEREREVMDLVASGLMNKIISDQLAISEVTVKAHRGRVMRKMQARSLAELVLIAAKLRNSQGCWCPPSQFAGLLRFPPAGGRGVSREN
jgi:FixJ family two-component response regulator